VRQYLAIEYPSVLLSAKVADLVLTFPQEQVHTTEDKGFVRQSGQDNHRGELTKGPNSPLGPFSL